MRIDAIVIAVLYNHFIKMKKKGRKVIPWFQTVSVLSFTVIVSLILLYLIVDNIIFNGNLELGGKEQYFLVLFIVSIVIVFLIIKKYYFDSNRHILFLAAFQALSVGKQKRISIITLSALCILPFLLIYCLYLNRG